MNITFQTSKWIIAENNLQEIYVCRMKLNVLEIIAISQKLDSIDTNYYTENSRNKTTNASIPFTNTSNLIKIFLATFSFG